MVEKLEYKNREVFRPNLFIRGCNQISKNIFM